MASTLSLYASTEKYDKASKDELTLFKKGDKPPKDENAPKKPLSAFLRYCEKHRSSVMEDNEGEGVGKIQKKLGEMWKNCDPDEKKSLETQAAKDKGKYDRLMNAYKMSGDYQLHQEKLLQYKIWETRQPFPKDPKVPKKSLSAYMLYCNDARPRLLKKNPGMKVTEVMQTLAGQWKNISEANKKKWDKKALKAKEARLLEYQKYLDGSDYQDYLKKKKEYEVEMEQKRRNLRKKRAAPKEEEEPVVKKTKKSSVPKKKASQSKKKASQSKKAMEPKKQAAKKAETSKKSTSTQPKKSKKSSEPKKSKKSSEPKKKAKKSSTKDKKSGKKTKKKK